jgi:hypothetical protein
LCINQPIPKSDDSITLLLQIRCSAGVFVSLFGMLATVDFDYQAAHDATKIGKARDYSVLPAEFEACFGLSSELSPQFLVFVCGLSTKPSASLSRNLVPRIHNRAPQKAR